MQLLYSLRVSPFESHRNHRFKSDRVSLLIEHTQMLSPFKTSQKHRREIERSVQFQALVSSKVKSSLKVGEWVRQLTHNVTQNN